MFYGLRLLPTLYMKSKTFGSSLMLLCSDLLAMDSQQWQSFKDASTIDCIKEKIVTNFCKMSFNLASPQEFVSFDWDYVQVLA